MQTSVPPDGRVRTRAPCVKAPAPVASPAARYGAPRPYSRPTPVELWQLGDLLFRLLSKLFERTSAEITTKISVNEWATVFGEAKMTNAMLDRSSQHCLILQTENDSFRFNAS